MESEDKTIEQRIKELEETRIISVIGDSISILDTDYKILYRNRVNKDFIGNHVGEYCYKAYEGREQVCEGCALEASFKDGKMYTIERSTITENGIEHFEITASLLKDSTGETIAGIEIVRDVTERKKADEALKTLEANYRSIFNSVNEIIVIHDIDNGDILDVNQKFYETFGYTQKEAMRLKVEDISFGEPPYSQKERLCNG